MGPLSGMRVLEWASWISTPTAGYMLADLGADVIKIEDPVRGDASRGHTQVERRAELPGNKRIGFETANRNKRSMTLDLQSATGRELLYHMVRQSDVFLTSFDRETTRRNHVDWPALQRENPKLVYGYGGSGFGSLGPLSQRRSYDYLIQGYSGLMWGVGDRGSPEPSSIAGAIIDTAGGTLLAYAVLAALYARERTGQGQEVTASLLGAALHLQGMNVNRTLWTGQPMPRNTRVLANVLLGQYRCADDQWLVLAEPQFQRFWPEFCAATGIDPDSSALPHDQLVKLVDATFATRPRDEWLTLFEARHCHFAYAALNRLDEALAGTQAHANQYVVGLQHPTLGDTQTVGFPVAFSATPYTSPRPAPEFGQHTEDVLMELCALDWEAIARLRESGVIA